MFGVGTHMVKKLLPYALALALIGVAAVIAVPNFVRVRTHSAAAPCINFLRQLDGAKQQWQLEYNKTTNDTPTLDDLKPYIKLTSAGEIPRCPQGGTYIAGRIGEPPQCSMGGEYHTLPQ
jgi:hypothetical protein